MSKKKVCGLKRKELVYHRLALKESLYKKKAYEEVKKIGVVFYCDGMFHWRHDNTCTLWMIGDCPNITSSRVEKKVEKIKAEVAEIRDGEARTFENYDVDFNRHKKQVLAIKNFLNSKTKTLFIGGRPGRGKSHLAEAFLYYAIHDFKNARMTTSLELARVFRACAVTDKFLEFGKPNPALFLSEIIEAELVIIDEFGAEKRSEFFSTAFKEMWNCMSGKKILVTNFGFDTLHEKYDESFMSRILSGAKKVVLEGEDYRLKGGVK